MEKVIWKFKISVGLNNIEMPKGAEPLSVQNQHEQSVMWALCDPKETAEMRRFLVVGTGHSFNTEKVKYIGTFQSDDGNYVWHLFELVNS